MIVVQSLSFRYPDGRMALQKLSFQIEPGESVGLIGPNGAGKTTLFLCLAGVLSSPRGTISVDGLDPADPAQRRQMPNKLGIVFQNSDDQLFSATVAEDVAFGPFNLGLSTEEVTRRVRESLDRVGLQGADQRPPFHLSGGEKRRAAIAGVLAMQPMALLLDEPSIFLDVRGRRGLITLLNELSIAKLIASHDLAFVRETCQKILLLDNGQLVAQGGREILHDSALLEAHGLEAL